MQCTAIFDFSGYNAPFLVEAGQNGLHCKSFGPSDQFHNLMSSKNKPQKELTNRTFGLIFAGIFLLIALFPLLGSSSIRMWALITCGVFATMAIAFPWSLTPLNRLWAKFGMLMHKITNPILMGLVFFIAVFPTGLILRLAGKDPMRRKVKPELESYWIQREQSELNAESFDQQF